MTRLILSAVNRTAVTGSRTRLVGPKVMTPAIGVSTNWSRSWGRSMSEYKELLRKLAAPFDPARIHWRVGATTKDKSKGIALAYINARDVMRRLDQVMGLDWQ